MYIKLKAPQGALNVHLLLINSKEMQILCTVETHSWRIHLQMHIGLKKTEGSVVKFDRHNPSISNV